METLNKDRTKEVLELQSGASAYIKCTSCQRLSPKQKFCKYCFAPLEETQNRRVYIIEEKPEQKPYTPVSDYAARRQKIDAEFSTSSVNYEALGLSEQEHRLKFSAPGTAQKVIPQNHPAYKAYPAPPAQQAQAAQTKKMFVPEAPVIQEEDTNVEVASSVAEGQKRAHALYTVRRNTKFSLSFLSSAGALSALAAIISCFLPVMFAYSGWDLISFLPTVIGVQTASALPASTGAIFSSVAFMLSCGFMATYAAIFLVRSAVNKKLPAYALFSLSFAAVLSNILLLFGALMLSATLADFAAGFALSFISSGVCFVCSLGELKR